MRTRRVRWKRRILSPAPTSAACGGSGRNEYGSFPGPGMDADERHGGSVARWQNTQWNMSEPTNNEQKWLQGNRAAWLAILNHALRELTWDTSEVETSIIGMARAVAHLEETRKALRIACDDHGDNDWDDSLCLADVIEKHLIRHLDEPGDRDV